MSQKINIIVDDREVGSGIMDIFHAIDGVSIGVRRLTLGDYEVDGRLLVERKTLLDLTESIKDGRLFRQACKLAKAPLRSVDGVGSTTAERICWAIREPESMYDVAVQ